MSGTFCKKLPTRLLHCVFCVACVLLLACSKEAPRDADDLPPPKAVDDPSKIAWSFLPGGISVTLKAESSINVVREKKHAVLIKLLQLDKKDVAEQMIKTSAGIIALLEGDGKDAGVLRGDSYYIQPGAQMEFTLDRTEGAKFFAVVAGFDSLDPRDCFSITPMPVHQGTERDWLVMSKDVYSPAPLDAKIFLTKQKVEMKGFERVQK